MKALYVIFALMISAVAYAQATNDIVLAPIKLPETITIASGDTKIIPLPRYTFIDRVTLEIKNGFLCGKASAQISFDGYGVQNIPVQSGWFKAFRNKIVTVGNNARNIEITNNSRCKIKVRQINVLPRRWNSSYGGHGPVYFPASEAASQVSFLLETFIYVESLVGDADRIQYISPMKKALGKALAVLQTAPETSQASLKAIQEVIKTLQASEKFVEKLQSIESTFEIAKEIETVQVVLERMTR